MTDTSGPFEPDKPWAEAEWFRHMPAAMKSGVIGTRASSATAGPLAFSSSGLAVTLAVGNANVGGAGFSRTAPAGSTAVPPNTNSSLSRRDRIVLRRSLASHDVTPVVIQGTPAATPVAPAITQDATTFDLKMFSFLVPPSSGTSISGVVDERAWVSDGATEEQTISKSGAASVTSNPSGDFTVTHGLGFTPTFVTVQSRFTGNFGAQEIAVTAVTPTTFTARAFYNNDPQASQAFNVYWRVEATFS